MCRCAHIIYGSQATKDANTSRSALGDLASCFCFHGRWGPLRIWKLKVAYRVGGHDYSGQEAGEGIMWRPWWRSIWALWQTESVSSGVFPFARLATLVKNGSSSRSLSTASRLGRPARWCGGNNGVWVLLNWKWGEDREREKKGKATWWGKDDTTLLVYSLVT